MTTLADPSRLRQLVSEAHDHARLALAVAHRAEEKAQSAVNAEVELRAVVLRELGAARTEVAAGFRALGIAIAWREGRSGRECVADRIPVRSPSGHTLESIVEEITSPGITIHPVRAFAERSIGRGVLVVLKWLGVAALGLLGEHLVLEIVRMAQSHH